MEASTKQRRNILALVFVVIVAGTAGSWYFLKPKSQSKPSLPPAPDFSITDLDGNTFWLGDFRGKVVVIDFMATWCPPCKIEMQHLKVVWEEYESKIVLISIDIDPRESEEVLSAFAKEFPYATWIWARDTANLGRVYEVSAIPKMVIIDQDGYIKFTHTGVTDASTLIQEIDQLLS